MIWKWYRYQSLDEDIHDRIGRIKSKKTAAAEEIKGIEEETTSKAQEGRDNSNYSWNRKDKTKSGEYALSRSPKTPVGKEAKVGATRSWCS